MTTTSPSPAERAKFRSDVRAWLAANVAGPLASYDTVAGAAEHRAWEKRLHAAGLSVVTWPTEYGGQGRDLIDWLAFEEEYWAAGAPVRLGQNGIFLLGPALLEYGTAEQKARFLPHIADTSHVWAQGWSEPDAGSDLASVRSRGVRVEGGWRVSGQKTWSTRAPLADWLFGLFRTDPDSERHRGISYLFVPLDASGVTVRPIRQLDGEAGFGEVFFDDVFVPDDQVLGEPGAGWTIAMSTTVSERGLMLRSPGRFMASADRLVQLWRDQTAAGEPAADALGDQVVSAWMNADAYRLYVTRTAQQRIAGRDIGAESSANKLFWSQLDLDIHETALALLGERATFTTDPEVSQWLAGLEFAMAGPIYAGTNEVQRNILAERVLGMPRK